MIERVENGNEKHTEHHILIRDRKDIEISGVMSVESFDEESIVLCLEVGRLIVEGAGLHIGELSLDSHRVTAQGEVISLLYSERQEKGRSGLFRRKG